MDNFDPYNVFLAIATNIAQRLETGFVVQGHIYTRSSDLIHSALLTLPILIEILSVCTTVPLHISNIIIFSKFGDLSFSLCSILES